MRWIALMLVALCAAPAGARAQMETPDAVEYAVWSAVLRQVYGRDLRQVRIQDSTATIVVDTVRDAAMVRWLTGSTELVDSLRARVTRPATVDRRALRVRRPRIVGRDAEERYVVSFSRVAFDAERRRALVHASASCGMLCGSGGLVLLEKDRDGRWRFAHHVTMYLS